MDGDSRDKEEPPHQSRTQETRSNSRSALSAILSRVIRNLSRHFARVHSTGTPGSSLTRESEPQLQHEYTPQSEDQSKEPSKDQSKDQSKNLSKDQSNNHSKNLSRDQTKNQSKEQSRGKFKDQFKNQSKNLSNDQVMDQTKNLSKDQTKTLSKDQSRGHFKNQPKDQSKYLSKDQSKNPSKDQSWGQFKDQFEKQSKGKFKDQFNNQSKNLSNDQVMDQPKNLSKDQTKTLSKDQSRGHFKNQPKDQSKDLSKDQSKNPSKDQSWGQFKNQPKDQSKDLSKDPCKDQSKNSSKDQSWGQFKDQFEKQSKDLSKNQFKDQSKNLSNDQSNEQTRDKFKDHSINTSTEQSRGRSRERRRPSPGRFQPRRARSMSRPPSMERVPDISPDRRSTSLDRSSESGRNRSMDRGGSVENLIKFVKALRRESPGTMTAFMRRNRSLRKSPCQNCAVCGSVSSDPFISVCGHSLCRDCLTRQGKTGMAHMCRSLLQSSSSLNQYKRHLENISENETLNSPLTQLIADGKSDRSRHIETDPDLFQPSPSDQKPVKVVVTRGEAGMGKTVSVQKFTLDWAQGSEHQELELVLPLSFRDLNMVRGGHYSLLEVIHTVHPLLEVLTAEELAHMKVLFIFDGLDESLLPLNFSCEVISKVTQRSDVSTLFTNLIKGHLLPDALKWITSRPAAANQIPVQYVDRYTEICGFTSDQQKEQYFRKRFRDEDQCGRVLSFIKSSHTLWSMCQSPVFCWITATALEHRLQDEQSDLPSLTELFVQFLLVQMQMKKRKYECMIDFELTAAEQDLLLKLGKLVLRLLREGHALFTRDDLQIEELDVTETLVYSGLCTEVFQQPSNILNPSHYSFVHPGVAQFLAAVYAYHCFNKQNKKEMKGFELLHDQNTPLQLECFLHELSLEKNQRLLGALNSGLKLPRLPLSDQNHWVAVLAPFP